MLFFLYLLLSPRSSLVAHREIHRQTDGEGGREGERGLQTFRTFQFWLTASQSFVSSHLQLFTARECCCCLGHVSSCIVRVATVLMHFPNFDLQFFKSRLCLCPPLSEMYRGVNVLCVCLSNMCSLITSPPPFSYLCPVSAFCIVRSSSCLLYVPRASGRGSFAVSASLLSFSMSVASSPFAMSNHYLCLSLCIDVYLLLSMTRADLIPFTFSLPLSLHLCILKFASLSHSFLSLQHSHFSYAMIPLLVTTSKYVFPLPIRKWPKEAVGLFVNQSVTCRFQ